jgi:hypothetical protein
LNKGKNALMEKVEGISQPAGRDVMGRL